MTIEILLTPITNYLSDISGYLFNANQRIYWLYLATSLALAYVAYRQHAKGLEHPLRHFIRFVFPPNIWRHRSTYHDVLVFLINRLLKLSGATVSLVLMAPIAIAFSGFLDASLGQSALLATPLWLVGLSFTFILFVLDDFTRFLTHYLLHKIPLLWEFHKVHHSAKVLTPITIYRSHPCESLLFATRMAGTQGIAVGVSYYLFGPTLEMTAILGANAFVFIFNIMGSNLRHSHVWLSWGDTLEKFFISPAQHQIHHSNHPAHFDRNFGSALAIWDRLFCCFMLASAVKQPRHLTFGLSRKNTEHQTLIEIYFMPFVLAAKLTIKPILTRLNRHK